MLGRIPRALGDGIEDADFLQRVPEEIQAVGLVRGDRINVHNAAAHGVLAGRLAHRLAVVVKGSDQFEQTLERKILSPPQFGLTGGKVGQGRHRLEQGRGGSQDEQGAGIGRGIFHPAQLAQHSQPIAGGVEGFTHLPALGLRKWNDLQLRFVAAGRVE